MTREEYLSQRSVLIIQAEQSIKDGKLEDYTNLENQIKDLDDRYQKETTAQANLNALSNSIVATQMNGINKAINLNGEKVSFGGMSNDTIYENAFAKYCHGDTLTDMENSIFKQFNAHQSNDVTSSGTVTTKNTVVVPTTWAKEIWHEASEIHPILQDVRPTHTPGDIEETITEVDSEADFYDENETVKSSNVNTKNIHLTGYDLAELIIVSWRLQKMSLEEFIPWLKFAIAEKVSNKMAYCYFNGKGVASDGDDFKSQPTGVITALKFENNTPHVISVSSVTYDSITTLIGTMKSSYAKTSKLYANHQFIWFTLANIKDNNNRPIFIPNPSDSGVGKVLGYEVVEDSAMPDNTLLLGDFTHYYRCNIQEDLSVHTQDNVKERATNFMAYAIIDSKPKTTSAFVMLEVDGD